MDIENKRSPGSLNSSMGPLSKMRAGMLASGMVSNYPWKLTHAIAKFLTHEITRDELINRIDLLACYADSLAYGHVDPQEREVPDDEHENLEVSA